MPRLTFSTTIGTCGVSWHDAGLTGFELPEALASAGDCAAAPAVISGLIARVRSHLAGGFQDFSDVAFDFSRVPEFHAAVLRATLRVKAGTTCSYGDIARSLGHAAPVSRAVGSALGANPWPLIVPCHRIVSASGKMTGFSGPGGIKTKLRLLAIEGAQLLAE